MKWNGETHYCLSTVELLPSRSAEWTLFSRFAHSAERGTMERWMWKDADDDNLWTEPFPSTTTTNLDPSFLRLSSWLLGHVSVCDFCHPGGVSIRSGWRNGCCLPRGYLRVNLKEARTKQAIHGICNGMAEEERAFGEWAIVISVTCNKGRRRYEITQIIINTPLHSLPYLLSPYPHSAKTQLKSSPRNQVTAHRPLIKWGISVQPPNSFLWRRRRRRLSSHPTPLTATRTQGRNPVGEREREGFEFIWKEETIQGCWKMGDGKIHQKAAFPFKFLFCWMFLE